MLIVIFNLLWSEFVETNATFRQTRYKVSFKKITIDLVIGAMNNNIFHNIKCGYNKYEFRGELHESESSGIERNTSKRARIIRPCCLDSIKNRQIIYGLRQSTIGSYIDGYYSYQFAASDPTIDDTRFTGLFFNRLRLVNGVDNSTKCSAIRQELHSRNYVYRAR